MDSISIASMATNLKTVQVQQAVAVSVMKMALDLTEVSAQGLIDIMQTSTGTAGNMASPHLGTQIDILA